MYTSLDEYVHNTNTNHNPNPVKLKMSPPPHYGQSSVGSVGLGFVGSVIRSGLSAVTLTISLIMTVGLSVTWQYAVTLLAHLVC